MPNIRRFLPVADDRYMVLSNTEVQEYIQILSPHKIGKDQLWFLDAMDFTASILMGYMNTSIDDLSTSVTASLATKAPLTGEGTSGTWPINITGNAATATSAGSSTTATSADKLTTSRLINGTGFDGTANITTASWGTARTLTIGSTGKSVNGSANIGWTLTEIGAAPIIHTHTTTDITSGTFANARIAVGNVTQHQAALSIGWGQLTGLPAFATRWPTWTEVTEKPTTFAPSAHTHAWADITSGKPTTLAGYGITDAAPLSHVGAGGTAHAAVTTTVAGFMTGADKTKLDGIAAGAQPGTVTSVTGGNGLTGSVTTSGAITLGTPSTLSGSTTNSVTATSHTHALSTNLSAWDDITPASKLDVGAKAADADLLDGIDSGRFVFGNSTNKTSSYGADWNAAMPSGFYDSSAAINGPATGWNWSINVRHSNTSNHHGFQLNNPISTNELYFRGISAGTPYAWGRVWHSGNHGSGSGLDADLLDGYNVDVGASINTIPVRNGAGDIYARLFRSTFTNQSTISGALAFRVNNGADDYIRFCNDPAAIRTFLDAASLGTSETFNSVKTFAPGGGGFASMGNFHSMRIGDRPGADGHAILLLNPLGVQGGMGLSYQESTSTFRIHDWGTVGVPVRWSMGRTTGDVTMTGGFTNNVAFQSGLNFGSQVAASATDLSKHIALWGATFGFSITTGTVNLVAAGTAHPFTASGYTSPGTIRGRLVTTTRNAATTLDNVYVNTVVEKNNTTAYTYTLAASSGAQGDVITVINSGTAGNITIARAAGVALYKGGTDANLTVSPGTSANLYRSATTNRWVAL